MTNELKEKNRTFESLQFANNNKFDKKHVKSNKNAHQTTQEPVERRTILTSIYEETECVHRITRPPGKGYPQNERFPLQNRMNGRTVKKSNGGERHLYQCYVINVLSLPQYTVSMCESVHQMP